MNLKLLIGLIALSLTACVPRIVREESPASDLTALESSVARDLREVRLPNGRTYCAELARTEDEQDTCLGDLEDALFTSNADKERARATLHKGIERLRLQRAPCKWYQLGCRRRAAKLDDR